MNIILICVFMVSLYGVKYNRIGYRDNYLLPENTRIINGIFVLFVFMRHFGQYIEYGNMDFIFERIDTYLGQLIVVPFLFYSGYGVMVSIIKKGTDYIYTIPRRRIFKVWYHFAIAIMLFMIMNFVLGKSYSWENIILSFTGWISIGNSNWYVMAVLAMYFVTYISFILFPKNERRALVMIMILCMVYIFTLHQYKDSWYYDTVVVYAIGMFYGYKKEQIQKFVQKSPLSYWGALICCIFIAVLSFKYRQKFVWFEILSVMFSVIVVWTTMKFAFGNKVLVFLGKYTFEIYILQRLPMRLFQSVIDNTYIYFFICFSCTIIISVILRCVTDRVDKIMIKF